MCVSVVVANAIVVSIALFESPNRLVEYSDDEGGDESLLQGAEGVDALDIRAGFEEVEVSSVGSGENVGFFDREQAMLEMEKLRGAKFLAYYDGFIQEWALIDLQGALDWLLRTRDPRFFAIQSRGLNILFATVVEMASPDDFIDVLSLAYEGAVVVDWNKVFERAGPDDLDQYLAFFEEWGRSNSSYSEAFPYYYARSEEARGAVWALVNKYIEADPTELKRMIRAEDEEGGCLVSKAALDALWKSGEMYRTVEFLGYDLSDYAIETLEMLGPSAGSVSRMLPIEKQSDDVLATLAFTSALIDADDALSALSRMSDADSQKRATRIVLTRLAKERSELFERVAEASHWLTEDEISELRVVEGM